MSARQLAFDLPCRPALGMEDFLVADCNREAVAWIDRWPDWPDRLLTVFGPPGCGKTHIAHLWQARSGAILVTAGALGGDARALLGAASAAVVEDLETPLPQPRERALFHLHGILAERGGHLMLTARAAPRRWTIALPDLASRLSAAPAVAVGAPDEALLGAVLVKLFRDRQLAVPDEAITYLMARMERSFDAARTLVAAIDRASLAAHRKVTVPLVREVLSAARD